MKHILKTHIPQFLWLAHGLKTFDIRKADRGFQAGDELLLREFDPVTKKYTGRAVTASITNLMTARPEWGLMDGYVILSLGNVVATTYL